MDLAQFAILAFIVGSSLAGAFTHMHDWTRVAVPRQAEWLCWSNAVTSELLPTSSFLSIRKRQIQGRSVTAPLWIFLGSAALSLCAQLSATGVRLPYDTQFLACLPAIAVLILSKLIFGDIEYARKRREEEAARAERAAERGRVDAERKAELARAEAERKAELAAELARKQEAERTELERRQAERDAELAAERERELARIQAEAQAEQIRIEQEAITRREELAAAERREARLAQQRREDEAARIRAEADADARRVEAQARAERERAEAARLAAEAEEKRQALALLAAAERPAPADDSDKDASPGRRRLSRVERRQQVNAVLAMLPAGTAREVAVAAVADRLDVTARYAREFVPEDWVAGSSAAGSGGGEPHETEVRRLALVSGG